MKKGMWTYCPSHPGQIEDESSVKLGRKNMRKEERAYVPPVVSRRRRKLTRQIQTREITVSGSLGHVSGQRQVLCPLAIEQARWLNLGLMQERGRSMGKIMK